MNLTEKARSDLEEYLRDVRTSLEGDPDVDPDHVVEGIREHVAAALAGLDADPGTAEDLADVLLRLGSPGQWREAAPPAPGRPESESARRRESRHRTGWEVTPLLLVAGGGILILAELAAPLGWGLLAAGALTARIVIGSRPPGPQSLSAPEGLTSLLWHVAVVTFATALVLFPAILVWSQSQTGGILEPLIMNRTLPPGATPFMGDRPGGYWSLVALTAGLATGVWWTMLGLVARRAPDPIDRVLGPASWLASDSLLAGLLVCGALLLGLCLLLVVGVLA